MATPVALIVNPAAGGGRAAAVLPDVEAALAAADVPFHTELTTDLEHARALARAALAAGEPVATLGGDGLVGCVAGVLADTDGVLGVLPGGRGNDFARVLEIPKDPAAACAIIAAGHVRRLDLGDVDGRPFVGIASAGFDSECNRIANETNFVKGNLVYAYSVPRALLEWKPARFELDLDGRERITYSGYSVACANSSAYGGGMYVAPDAKLDDGELDVVMTGRSPRRRFVLDLPKVFKGTHVDSPAVHILRAREIRVSADRPFTMYADGDPIGDLPVTVRVRAAALNVLSPA